MSLRNYRNDIYYYKFRTSKSHHYNDQLKTKDEEIKKLQCNLETLTKKIEILEKKIKKIEQNEILVVNKIN
jgi:predicted RNase H-like nuclease (RuvC/YqgF family)